MYTIMSSANRHTFTFSKPDSLGPSPERFYFIRKALKEGLWLAWKNSKAVIPQNSLIPIPKIRYLK